MTSWLASNEVGTSAGLEALQDALPVDLIATPRAEFVTCGPDDTLAEILAREYDFDHIPVVERPSDGVERIVGLLDLVSVTTEGLVGGSVANRMSRLTENNLIGTQASLLSFVRSARERPCRLVVAGERISGIVTLSDLQKLPVRAALFALVTNLEAIMSGRIEALYSDPQNWMDILSDKRKQDLSSKIRASKAGEGFVNAILFTQFCDKRDIISKSGLFQEFDKTFTSDLHKIEKIRNALAHGNHYADTPDSARHLCLMVQRIDHWTSRLSLLT